MVVVGGSVFFSLNAGVFVLRFTNHHLPFYVALVYVCYLVQLVASVGLWGSERSLGKFPKDPLPVCLITHIGASNTANPDNVIQGLK